MLKYVSKISSTTTRYWQFNPYFATCEFPKAKRNIFFQTFLMLTSFTISWPDCAESAVIVQPTG